DPGEAADFPRAVARDEERDPLDKFEVTREDYFAERPVPKELKEPVVGARELNDYGKWVVIENVTYWQPVVEANWQPYFQGWWSYVNSSCCWNPFEPWGFTTCHFGRWCHRSGCGWLWCPGTVFSPAWVCWGTCGNLISWCPLDPFNQPCWVRK